MRTNYRAGRDGGESRAAGYRRRVLPPHLPVWLNITLGVLAAAGATERALRVRYNWLLDGLGI